MSTGFVRWPALLAALLLGAAAYGVVKYGPVWSEVGRVRGVVAEAGQRLAEGQSEAQVRAWFSRAGGDRGLPWLDGQLLHIARDGAVVDVGLSWTVTVHHVGIGSQTLTFRHYCSGRTDGCDRYTPVFD